MGLAEWILMADLEIIRPRQLSRWQRLVESVRSFTLGPWNIKDKELARHFGGRGSSAGVSVNEDSSLTFSAVWNAIGLIAGDIAKVPLPLYRKLPNGGKEQFRDHYLYDLVHDEPNPEMSSFQFRRALQAHVLLWGNGYAEIERDGASRPVALWPLMPWEVAPVREGGLKYRVRQPSGKDILFDRRDMLHLSGLGGDGIFGYQPIQKAMESIGLGMATERFGATFFGNGATFGGAIEYPVGAASSLQARESARQALERRHQGVDRAHRLLALYDGGVYKQLGVAPDQAQFIETRRFQIEEVARWFNIPVHKLKELARSTNNNIEHQGIEYATDTLQPWFRMWEGELKLKLIPRLERRIQFFEHITEALTRGDSAAQGSLISQQFNVGGMSPNEIRAKFNYNPRPDGEDIYVPSQTMPARLAIQYWEAQIEKTKADAEAAKRPPPTPTAAPSAEAKAENERLQWELDLARRALQQATDAKDVSHATLADVTVRLAQALEAYEEIDGDRQAVTQERDALKGEVASVRTDLATLTEVVAALAQERDGLKATVTATEAQRDEAGRQVEQWQTDWAKEAAGFTAEAAMRTQVEADRDDLARRLAEAEQGAVDIATELDDQIAGRAADAQAHGAALEELRDALKQSSRTRDELSADVAKVTAERDEARNLFTAENMRAQSLEALKRSAEDEVVAVRSDLVKLTADEQSAVTERDMLSQDVDTLQQQLQGAELALETERQRTEAQRAIVRGALLQGFQDATDRLLLREANRAQNAQATPEKLRALVENFYPLHSDVVRAAFRPFSIGWTALQGGDQLALLDKLVTQHLETSTTAIRQVADVDDPDQMASALSRTLRRWETERSHTVAEAILREGVQR
jgi:HK97 family phage portal protein